MLVEGMHKRRHRRHQTLKAIGSATNNRMSTFSGNSLFPLLQGLRQCLGLAYSTLVEMISSMIPANKP